MKISSMALFAQFMKQPLFVPQDDLGGGDAAAPAANDAPPPASSDTPAPAANDAPPPAGSDTPSTPWWKGSKLSDDQRSSLEALGLTVDDPIDATAKLIDMERNAKKRLGASPDQLIQKPKDGQSVAEWMHENRNVFGIPEAPDKYEIAMPEGFGTGPNDLKWDGDFETKAREMAHKHGIPGEALQELTNLYASKVQGLSQDADAQYEASNQKMMGELKTDWGDQTTAKIAMAKSAAEMLATTAGLGSEQLSGIAQVLSDKTGDAGAIKMFAAIGEMMAEDGVGKLPGNGGSLAMTPANARAELAKQKAPGGEYYEAVAKGDTATLARLKPKIDQLEKQAAPQ